MRFLSSGFALAAASLVLVAATPPLAAHAQYLAFYNGVSNNAQAYFSDPSYVDSISGTPFFVAETFTLNQATTINTIQWYGAYAYANTPQTDNFTISFYNTTGGVPDSAPIYTFAVGSAISRTSTGGSYYLYSSSLPTPPTLAAGTYGLGIVDDTTSDTDDNWAWATSSQTGNHYERKTSTGTFTSRGDELAFSVFGSDPAAAAGAPEPGSIALVLTGGVSFAGVASVRLRRRRRNARQAKTAA